ncbi:uncharacterized protein LOC111318178 isoform X1 [Durio zibethinus]|uniref:Uncharacterized protein LOC111318178 isoform X1 n=1 Tax=Durio zibethinus TaxID=66656 RepID=A0A6P6BHR7_DURZI|nr:uncharacterized protein LOC111318178 isoform X1 [Durio zibethinus]
MSRVICIDFMSLTLSELSLGINFELDGNHGKDTATSSSILGCCLLQFELSSGQGGASGLLKLQDDVKTCGYKDVQVMWNLLNTSQIKQIGAAAATTAVSQSRKCSKQRPSWMAFFWPNQRATPPSSSSSCWVKSSKTVY